MYLAIFDVCISVSIIVYNSLVFLGERVTELPTSYHHHAEEEQFHAVTKIIEQQKWISMLGQIGSFVVLALCVRLMNFLALHPRLAVMVKTIRMCYPEIVSFTLYFMSVAAVFVVLSHYTFAGESSAFVTFYQATYTLFRYLTGDFSFAETPGSTSYLIFLIIYTVIIFFILLNFFLAIIVNSFTAVELEIKNIKGEKSAFLDTIDLIKSHCKYKRHGWPARSLVLKYLLGEGRGLTDGTVLPAVTAEELYAMVLTSKGTKAFKSIDSAVSFATFYIQKVKKRGQHPLEETQDHLRWPPGHYFMEDPSDILGESVRSSFTRPSTREMQNKLSMIHHQIEDVDQKLDDEQGKVGSLKRVVNKERSEQDSVIEHLKFIAAQVSQIQDGISGSTFTDSPNRFSPSASSFIGTPKPSSLQLDGGQIQHQAFQSVLASTQNSLEALTAQVNELQREIRAINFRPEPPSSHPLPTMPVLGQSPMPPATDSRDVVQIATAAAASAAESAVRSCLQDCFRELSEGLVFDRKQMKDAIRADCAAWRQDIQFMLSDLIASGFPDPAKPCKTAKAGQELPLRTIKFNEPHCETLSAHQWHPMTAENTSRYSSIATSFAPSSPHSPAQRVLHLAASTAPVTHGRQQKELGAVLPPIAEFGTNLGPHPSAMSPSAAVAGFDGNGRAGYRPAGV